MTTTQSVLAAVDPEIAELVQAEAKRQSEKIRLIPSENYVSKAVLEATASVLTNKYSEGYPGRRYYEGQQIIDQVEQLAIDRAKALFGAEHANVQAYSGSPANTATYFATVKPGDTIMGMSLPMGGHLTHGAAPTLSGKWFNAVQYGVSKDTGTIDFDQVRSLAKEHRPKVIVCGGTAIPRTIDFAAFRAIADEVEAILVADMAHIAGLVAGGAHPSPVGHAEIVTTTTHKSLRGPRGAMILCDSKWGKKIDSAILPGTQGGPHNHTTAAIAVALKEAANDDFKAYAADVVGNAKAFAEELTSRGFDLVSGGTDNHLILVDLSNKGIPGKPVAQGLDRAGIVCNFNAVPFDDRKPFDPSGIRLGTPAVTSRGMGADEMRQIAAWIDEGTDAVKRDDGATLDRIFGEVKELTSKFPAPGIDR